MKKNILKLSIVLMLIALPLMAVTNARYYDREKTHASFIASTLDFVLIDTDENQHTGDFFNENKLEHNTQISKKITVKNKGSLAFHYWPQFEYTNGSEILCGALQLSAIKNDEEQFKGSLSGFNLSTQSAHMDNQEVWEFILVNEDDDVKLQGKTCEFDIVFRAYQNANNQSGFSDLEALSNTVTTAYEPLVTTTYNTQLHTFSVMISNLEHFSSFNSTIKYVGSGVNRETTDFGDLTGENTKLLTTILGTCSDDGCTYDEDPHNFELLLRLVDSDGYIHTVYKYH